MERGSVISVLRTLRETPDEAPPTLVTNVMHEVGLADSYAVTESPLGPVIVAYGPEGITAVTPVVEDEVAFAAGYRTRRGRAGVKGDAPPPRPLGRPPVDLRGLSPLPQDVLGAPPTHPAGAGWPPPPGGGG